MVSTRYVEPVAGSSSKLRRLAKLGRLTGQVTRAYVGNKAASLLGRPEAERGDGEGRQQLERITEVLSQMKGAAMKLGQSAALVADALDLPDEVRAKLSKLHAGAEPVPWEQVRQDAEQSLETPLSEAFAAVDPEPLGTASLGQAHVAHLHDGREVVFKVLHRNIEADIQADLLALRTLLGTSRLLRRDADEVDVIFDEIRTRLLEETDYLQEAANLSLYRERVKVDGLIVPELIPELCSDRVLTMEKLHGEHLPVFREAASADVRNRAAETLAQTYYESAFRQLILHADPNPGNFLFLEDGTVGLVDFGCVKRFDEFWIGKYAAGALAAIDQDWAGYLSAVRDIGGYVGTDTDAESALIGFGDVLARPFRDGVQTLGGPTDELSDEVKHHTASVLRYRALKVPRDVLMLHRALGGLYSMAHQLVATADWGAIARPHMIYAVERAEGGSP